MEDHWQSCVLGEIGGIHTHTHTIIKGSPQSVGSYESLRLCVCVCKHFIFIRGHQRWWRLWAHSTEGRIKTQTTRIYPGGISPWEEKEEEERNLLTVRRRASASIRVRLQIDLASRVYDEFFHFLWLDCPTAAALSAHAGVCEEETFISLCKTNWCISIEWFSWY